MDVSSPPESLRTPFEGNTAVTGPDLERSIRSCQCISGASRNSYLLPWDESEFGAAKSRLSDEAFLKKHLGFTPSVTTGSWSIYGRERLEAFLMRYLKHKQELLRQKRGEKTELKAARARAMRVAALALSMEEAEADIWMNDGLEKWYKEVDENYAWLEEVEISARRILEGPAYWS